MTPRERKKEKLRHVIRDDVFITGKAEEVLTRFSSSKDAWIFDFRRIVLQPEHIDLIADIFWDTYKDKYPFQVCGLETAAIPLVTAIVMKSVQKGQPVNGFFIRKSRKKSGLLQMIEGNINDEKIVIVDDLINSGNSIARQLAVIDDLKKAVSDVFCIMHFRENFYYNFLEKRGITLTTLFPITDFDIPYREASKKSASLYNSFGVEWRFQSNKPNFSYVVPKSAPALDDKKVYFGSDSGNFWALNQSDGSVAWKYRVGFHAKGKGIFSSPAVHDGTVYFGAYDGNVYALDAETGKKKWIFMEADWIGSSPALAPDLGLLFIGLEFGLINKRGGIAALDLHTGRKQWEHSTPALTHGTPAYVKSHAIVAIGSNDGVAYLYGAKKGELLWQLQTQGDIKESFAFDEKRDIVLFGSFDGALYAINRKTGARVFVYQTNAAIYSTPLVYNDAVYVASLDKRLYKVSLDTGERVWTFETAGRIFSSPTEINGSIYIGSNDGRLYEIDPETGKSTGVFQATERITNKVAYNPETKRLFLPTFANEIYCLSKKAG